MAESGADTPVRDEPDVQRIDKWLWFSRVLKSRTLAAQLVSEGRVRVNRARVNKPSLSVRTGDVLTVAFRGKVQVLRILATGHRRGPPLEARRLYEVVEASGELQAPAAVARRQPGSGRPSKQDRRLTDRLTKQK